MKTSESNFDRFDRTMRELLKVPHEQLKARVPHPFAVPPHPFGSRFWSERVGG
jgi:hypothetical protein